MSSPTVCAILLTRDRPEMAARAVRCFREQTYENKRIVVFNSGPLPLFQSLKSSVFVEAHAPDAYCWTIGALRNEANYMASAWGADIIAHWDDDDLSHPSRLSEQVALLEASGADAVGYNQALFWDSTKTDHVRAIAGALGLEGCEERGEAWLYTSPKLDVALGATLLYWRRTWEQKPFQNVTHGEDCIWQTGMRVKAVSSLPAGLVGNLVFKADGSPRFVAAVHGSNTSSVITPTVRDWKRMPEWDEECRRLMAL